ncbi:MAG: GNAT family N-acetyltransferase [Candidatus Methylomirabilales bacterium]
MGKGSLASVVVIRDARNADNQALIELDRQCAMGGSIQLVLDRYPDFFARSRAYRSFHLVVAEEEGTIIGVGGVTFKTLRVNGITGRWVYTYDLRVRPTHRRRGVAGLIADALRDVIREQGVSGAYSWVVEGNTASEAFVERRGSSPLTQAAFVLMPDSAGGKSDGFERITERSDEVASLLEATYRAYQFTPQWDVGTLYGTLGRLGPLGWQGMYGKRVQGRWAVCFGLWDYDRVMQMTFRGGEAETHVRPFFLYPLGWRDPEHLREGLFAAQAMITAQGGTLLLPYVPGDPVSAFIPEEAFRIGMTLYVRGISHEERQMEGPLFIDPADL